MQTFFETSQVQNLANSANRVVVESPEVFGENLQSLLIRLFSLTEQLTILSGISKFKEIKFFLKI
jgi:hypothetical protein